MNAALPGHLQDLGFVRNPFPLTPDADCYFFGSDNQRHQMEVRHCLMSGKGFVLVSGEVGTGKSTFVRYLIDGLQEDGAQVALVLNTFLQGLPLLQAICRDFGLEAAKDQADDWLEVLNRHLIERHRNGQRSVLIIDDAQNLSLESLELVRILSNLETRQEKLLQILLTGQQELVEKLRQPCIRQLASRIAQHVQLGRLTLDQARHYVNFRLRECTAGGAEPVSLSASAMRALYRVSQGNPRRIHHVLDRALYGLSPAGRRRIGRTLIHQASTESGLAQPQARAKTGTLGALALLSLSTLVVAHGLWQSGRDWTALPWWPAAEAEEAHTTKMEPLPAGLQVQQAAPQADMATAVAAAGEQTPPAAEKTDPEAEALSGLHQCVLNLARRQSAPLPPRIDRDEYRHALQQAGWLILEPAAGTEMPSGHWYCSYRAADQHWLVWAPAVPSAPLAELSSRSIQALQLRLAAAGLYQGALDGIVGPRTLAALKAFTGHRADMTTGLNLLELFRLEAALHQAHTPITAGSRF